MGTELCQLNIAPKEKGVAWVGNVPDCWQGCARSTGSEQRQCLNGAADACHDISECRLFVLPCRKRFGIGRQGLQVCKGSLCPEYLSDQNRNDTSRAFFLSLEGALHLDANAIVRSEEIRTHEQKDDRGGVQMSINSLGPVGTRNNQPIMPEGNESLPLEQAQVCL